MDFFPYCAGLEVEATTHSLQFLFLRISKLTLRGQSTGEAMIKTLSSPGVLYALLNCPTVEAQCSDQHPKFR